MRIESWLMGYQLFFWLGVTLALYWGALRLQRMLGSSPLANPVLVASAPIIAYLRSAIRPSPLMILAGKCCFSFSARQRWPLPFPSSATFSGCAMSWARC